MDSPLPVHKRVGFLSLEPHCKGTIDGIADGRMLMIPSLWTTANQPLPTAVITAAHALIGLASSYTETASSSFGKIRQ